MTGIDQGLSQSWNKPTNSNENQMTDLRSVQGPKSNVDLESALNEHLLNTMSRLFEIGQTTRNPKT